MKKLSFVIMMAVLFFSGLAVKPAAAATTVKGTFVSVAYEDVQVDSNNVEKRLTSITLKNEKGQENTYNIDVYAKLSVDTLQTKIDAFKLGMKIEADVELRRVKALRGWTGTMTTTPTLNADKVVSGMVNKIDRYGNSISVLFDNGKSQTYYFNSKSVVFKGKTRTDRSVIFEGDRVKISLPAYNSTSIDTIEVSDDGVKIVNLYKGTIQRIEPSTNQLVVANEKVFRDWNWQTTNSNSTNSYTYSSKTPIYVGNELIKHEQLRHYANNEVYYVTVDKFGKEEVEKMVIKKSNERTYYEQMNFGLTYSKSIFLKKEGYINYHDGSILIRNGRLVDSNSMQAKGTAFVVTDGDRYSEYANVISITNDGFQSPNMTGYTVYYGQLDTADRYQLRLKNVSYLSDNSWKTTGNSYLSYSNDTVALNNYGSSIININPTQDDLKKHLNRWGYFYVKDGNIVAMNLTSYSSSPTAKRVSVGVIDSTNSYYSYNINVRDASEWINGSWDDERKIYYMNIYQAMIIKDGKVIQASDLNVDDRIYILHENYGTARLLLVD